MKHKIVLQYSYTAAIALFLRIGGGTNTWEGPGWVGQGGAPTDDVFHTEAENLTFWIIWEPFPTKKHAENQQGKEWSGTYAAWSLGSPTPPACVAAGASTAALHSREKGKKETHQCKKQLGRHFQTHLVFFFGCQGTGEQQKGKTPPSHPAALPCCNCRSGPQQSGFRRLLQPGAEEVAQGLGRVIKIHKARPVSQFFLEHQLLSKPLILKNKQRETPADSPPINTEWHPSC